MIASNALTARALPHPSGTFGAEADARLGSVLPGGYELVSLLGSGGMGSVYLARQRSLDRLVAVKMMHRELSSRPDAVEQFLVEARAASHLRHAASVTIFDFGQSAAGEMFLVMEHVDGPTLRQLFSEGELSALSAIDLILEVLGALGEAHHAGILHLDLKPDNVLVTRDRQGVRHVKVVDFGLARLLRRGEEARAEPLGLVYGTPGFISPERLGGGPLDHTADLYAVGVMLHQLLTGRVPSDTDTRAPGAVPRTLTKLRRVDGVAVTLPADLADLLARATAANPAVRPADARAFAEELLAIRKGLEQVTPSSPGDAPREAERPPLVGRERELAMVLASALTRRPCGQFIALRGVLGSGRTRLLDEVVGAARAAGRFVVRTGPDPLGVGISGAALRDIARQLVVPQTPAPSPPRSAEREGRPRNGERRAALLADATARLIEARTATSNGVLIAIDDFGDIDSLSRKTILDVIARGLPADMAIVVTAEASNAREVASERTIVLEPLSAEALRRLNPGAAVGAEAVPLAALLWEATDGAEPEGDLSAWHVIARALSALPDAARRILETTCVAGPGAIAMAPEEISAAIVALERSGLAIGTCPSHPLVRAVVREELSPLRRRALSAAALQRAVAQGERPEVLAHHAAAAGDAFTALVHLDRVATWRACRGDRAGVMAALAGAVDVVRSERSRSDSQLPDANGALRYFTARLAVARAR